MNDTVKSDNLNLLHQKIDRQIVRFDEHVLSEEKSWERLLKSQQETSKQINNLIECTDRLQKSTAGVVEAYKAAGNFGRFVRWVGSIVIILGAGWAWLTDHIKF
jgi:transposase-like protein